MFFIVVGMVIEVKPLQYSNAQLAMLVTEYVTPSSSTTVFGIIKLPFRQSRYRPTETVCVFELVMEYFKLSTMK
jgi:hypothetical protein